MALVPAIGVISILLTVCAMKRFVLMVAITFHVTTAGAQIQFGITAGAALSTIHPSSATPQVSNNLKAGFNLGALLDVSLRRHFGLQTEILYSDQGAKVNTNFEKVTHSVRYLDIPVLLSYNISPAFFVEV